MNNPPETAFGSVCFRGIPLDCCTSKHAESYLSMNQEAWTTHVNADKHFGGVSRIIQCAP